MRTHGETKRVEGKVFVTPEYRAWMNMRERCLNPKAPNYKHYGGRGISICDTWSTFSTFLRDVGRRPTAQHTLERTDNEKGYSKNNCCWATKKEQARNRRNARLTLTDVENIRALCAAGQHRYEDIGAPYGISRQYVSQLVRRVAWQ